MVVASRRKIGVELHQHRLLKHKLKKKLFQHFRPPEERAPKPTLALTVGRPDVASEDHTMAFAYCWVKAMVGATMEELLWKNCR